MNDAFSSLCICWTFSDIFTVHNKMFIYTNNEYVICVRECVVYCAASWVQQQARLLGRCQSAGSCVG